MFAILRFFIIVGVIFYFSPVRQKGEGPASLEAFLNSKAETTASVPAESVPGHLETVWQVLPDKAKQAVIDKILTSGLSPAPKASDTLEPGDRHPAWRAEGSAKPGS